MHFEDDTSLGHLVRQGGDSSLSLVLHLRLQLIEPIQHHDQLAGTLSASSSNQHEPAILSGVEVVGDVGDQREQRLRLGIQQGLRPGWELARPPAFHWAK